MPKRSEPVSDACMHNSAKSICLTCIPDRASCLTAKPVMAQDNGNPASATRISALLYTKGQATASSGTALRESIQGIH